MELLMNNDFPLPGTRLGSYLVDKQQPIPELNLTAVTLSHEPTGARHLHLACDDPNNVFAVGFRTPPHANPVTLTKIDRHLRRPPLLITLLNRKGTR
jgi:hypothetical protein